MARELDDIRERSRRVWDAMAAGWETRREDLWRFSHPASEWLVERVGVMGGSGGECLEDLFDRRVGALGEFGGSG